MKIMNALIAAGVLAVALAAASWSGESVTPKFEHSISNIPGKSLIAVEVVFPPGDVSVPHHHAPSAFLYVYVISGTIRSQVEGEPAHTYHAGESWFEAPGAHHVLAQNMSTTKPAKILAVFVVDSNDKALVTPDPTADKDHESTH
jgi:quercetin dioxygenase-like cupin family protein